MERYRIDFESRQQYIDLIKVLCKDNGVLVKFTADWCGPCKKIYDYCLRKFDYYSNNNVKCIEVDIDESFDIFAFLKQKKMIQGIPTLFYYGKGKDNYIPDESVSGIDENELEYFFNQVK